MKKHKMCGGGGCNCQCNICRAAAIATALVAEEEVYQAHPTHNITNRTNHGLNAELGHIIYRSVCETCNRSSDWSYHEDMATLWGQKHTRYEEKIIND